MAHKELKGMDIETLKNTRMYLKGKNVVWSTIGIVNMYVTVGAVLSGGFWLLSGAVTIWAAWTLINVPDQIQMVNEEIIEREGNGK